MPKSSSNNLIAIGFFGAVVLIAFIARFMDGRTSLNTESDNEKETLQEAEEALENADGLWGNGEVPDAVAAYKRLLKDHKKAFEAYYWEGHRIVDWDHTATAKVYRRIIEYEIQYGDSGEARDYMVEAVNDNRIKILLSIDSPEVKQMLKEVRKGR